MKKLNKKDDKMLINDDSYIGTIIEVGLNVAKFKINSYIKNAYSMVSGNLISLGRVNDYCIIYNVFCPILCKINYIHTSENDKKNIENKINSVNKYEMDTIGSLKYLGTIDKNLSFKNGIQVYPSVTDRVFMPTEEVLQKILWENNIEDKAYLEFAKDFHFKNIIPIAAEVIFNKHCAILGSSGCGKSNTVAKIIEEFVKNTDSNKKIILIDPTGEYGKIKDQGNMENIENDFYISREHVSLEDLCFYLNPSSQVQYPVLAEAVDKWQKNTNEKNTLTYEINNLLQNGTIRNNCLSLISRIENLEGMKIVKSTAGYTVNPSENNQNTEMNWLLRKNDSNLNIEICGKIDDFLKGNKKILRIDLSEFTSKHQSKELLINFLSNYIFTKRKKDKKNEKGMEDSVILCIDEAHNFLNKTMKYTDTEKKLDAVDIIAKEGRKYGLNLMLATQRTQDIPEDILSQIGFIISHKLSNEDDLRLIKNAISYMDETIMQAIPMLQTGHAFLLCSELKFPRQVIISQPSSPPESESKKWSKNKNS
jgi:hypothetical protein